MAGIAPIFEPVQAIFATVDHVFTPVAAILTAVTYVFHPIPHDGAPANRALREQRSRANEGEKCGNGQHIQGYSRRTHNEQPPELSGCRAGSAARLAQETSCFRAR